MYRNYHLAVVLGVLLVSGCASTKTAEIETRAKKQTEFRDAVAHYERIHKERSANESASEVRKQARESLGESGKIKADLPE